MTSRAAPTPPPGGVRVFGAAAGAAALVALGACTGAPAPTAPVGFACGAPATPIAAIQGPGPRSPLVGVVVEVEAPVSAVLEDGLGAIVLETPADAHDADAATSEGLFVSLAGARAARATMPSRIRPGVRLRVRGRVAEVGDGAATLTALEAVEDLVTCARARVALPETTLAAAPADWEALEGMRVHVPGPLTITGNDGLRFAGALHASFAGRLYVPTELAAPGPAAQARARANAAAAILLDDGFRDAPVLEPWYLGGLGAERPWRTGTTVVDVRGIVDQRDGAYRIELAERLRVGTAAPRPAAPPAVGGDLTLAAFNVLNFFDGDPAAPNGGFPTPRGATDPAEFARQRAKIVAAIATIRPDVAALMEIENDGAGAGSAQAALVDALNAALGADGDYRIAGSEFDRLGTDLIRVALIYRASRVATVGAAAVLEAAPFRSESRVPLAQTFVAAEGGAPFTVVAVHLKSKSSCPPDGPDADRGDGQGCWNRARTRAAGRLATWLRAGPTGVGTPDLVVLGDFNAYAQEDPIRALRDAGFVDVVTPTDPPPYSYVFMGRSGRLDHALASAAFAERVTGAAEWHVNADEAEAFDYNAEDKSAAQLARWYRPDPYRASDHDPLLIGLRAR